MQFPGFPCNSPILQQQMWMEPLSRPFRGKAAASPGDKESRTASGHVLNSCIVRQEEMCLGNVAVTTLKRHNSILTTSLRRCRSDKRAEEGAGLCRLRHPQRLGRLGPGEHRAPPWGMSHKVKPQTELCTASSAPTQCPGKALYPKGRPCIPPLWVF